MEIRLAWSNIVKKYQPRTSQALKQELHSSRLTDWTDDPNAWIDKLDEKQTELQAMSCTISDNDLIIHILNNLPKEYKNLVESELRELSSINLDGLRERINAKYKQLKKYKDEDENKEKEKAMIHKGKQEKAFFTRQFKGWCDLCSKWGHKKADYRHNNNNNNNNNTNGNNYNNYNRNKETL